MSVGGLARRVLGKRFFPVAGRAYRRFFVDLEAVAATLPPIEGTLLDIGGGDGDLINYYLPANPKARAVLIDLAPTVGSLIDPLLRDRVELRPGTSAAAYAHEMTDVPGMILVSDVLHHVPVAERPGFFLQIAELVQKRPTTLVIKDLEPSYLKARLSYLADTYISGDKQVQLIGREEVILSVTKAFGEVKVRETPLLGRNPPNYSLVFDLYR